jgi:hypothetical protein
MSRWYCKFDGATSGPFSRDELEYLHDRGQLTATTEIRLDGERAWSRADRTFTDLFPPGPAVMVAEPPAPQVFEQTALAEPAEPTKSGPPPLPTEESEAERRRRQMLLGGGVGIATAAIIFLLLWLLLTWGGMGKGNGLAGAGGQGSGQGTGSGSGTGPGSGSGSGGGQGSGRGSGTGSGQGTGSSTASNSSSSPGGNKSGGSSGQSSAGNSTAASAGDGQDDTTSEELALDPAGPPRMAFQKLKTPQQTTKAGGSAGSDDGGFLSGGGGGGGGSDGSEFLGVKVRGKIALVCDVSGSMGADFPILVRELREKFPKDTPLILVGGCHFGPPGSGGPPIQKHTGPMPYMPTNEFANDPNTYMAYNTTDAIIFAVEELKRNTVMFNNDLQDGGSESAITALEQLRKKKKFTLSGRSLNCEAPERLLDFIKSSGGDFKVDPLSRQISPAQQWGP